MKQFYLKQKVFSIRNRYTILDDKKNAIYNASSPMFRSRVLHLNDAKSNETLYTMIRKSFTFRPSYKVIDEAGKMVASTKKKRAFFKRKVEVASVYGDLVIEGNYRAHIFSIKQPDGREVAAINKKRLSWGDTYEIAVYADDHELFYLALILLIDSKYHPKRKRKNSSRRRR